MIKLNSRHVQYKKTSIHTRKQTEEHDRMDHWIARMGGREFEGAA